MADAEVQLAPDGSGKQVDTGTVTTGAGSVHRQRVAIGDPATGAAIAAVKNSAVAASDYGVAVRPVSMNWIQQINLNPTNATVGSSATFNSSAAPASVTIDLGDLSSGGPSFSKWRVFINTDQAGTLNLQQSPDAYTTNYTTLTAAILASTPTVVESLIALRYLRINYVNGASGNSVFVVRATLVGH